MITLMYVVGNLARTLGYITPADLRSDCASTNASVGYENIFSPVHVCSAVVSVPELLIFTAHTWCRSWDWLSSGRSAKDQCYFEAYVRKFVWSALEMTDTGFLPPQSVWGKAAPTFNDTTWRHKVIQVCGLPPACCAYR
jgi:hypothetical protein